MLWDWLFHQPKSYYDCSHGLIYVSAFNKNTHRPYLLIELCDLPGLA